MSGRSNCAGRVLSRQQQAMGNGIAAKGHVLYGKVGNWIVSQPLSWPVFVLLASVRKPGLFLRCWPVVWELPVEANNVIA